MSRGPCLEAVARTGSARAAGDARFGDVASVRATGTSRQRGARRGGRALRGSWWCRDATTSVTARPRPRSGGGPNPCGRWLRLHVRRTPPGPQVPGREPPWRRRSTRASSSGPRRPRRPGAATGPPRWEDRSGSRAQTSPCRVDPLRTEAARKEARPLLEEGAGGRRVDRPRPAGWQRRCPDGHKTCGPST